MASTKLNAPPSLVGQRHLPIDHAFGTVPSNHEEDVLKTFPARTASIAV